MTEQQLRKEHLKRAMADALITDNKERWLDLISEVGVLANQILRDDKKPSQRMAQSYEC